MNFTPISVYDPRLAGRHVHDDGVLFKATSLDLPPFAFGDTDPSLLDLPRPEEASEWAGHSIALGPIHVWRLTGAVMHPPFGIITIDDFVLTETLGHIPFHWPGYRKTDAEVTLPDHSVGAVFDEALAVAGGNYLNYYHWTLDILPKLQIAPFGPYPTGMTIILPPVVTLPQRDIMTELVQSGSPVYALGGEQAVRVQMLRFIPNLAGWGFAPQPQLAGFFDTVKRQIGVAPAVERRLYISRGDSKLRVLLNEAEVIACVRLHGFEVVELTGLDLAAQAKLFASASHIIAPHGAGLANLAFCQEGALLCELQMDYYLNWCFRRLAAMRGVRYGCIVGAAGPVENRAERSPHDLTWTVPLEMLEALLERPVFSATSNHPAVID
jgi:capsular polysaccharide biosynthesis protein